MTSSDDKDMGGALDPATSMGAIRRFSTADFTTGWQQLLWGDATALPAWLLPLRQPLRLLRALVRDFRSGMLSLQAMSLVYTTLLSLVPLLAVSFSVLKGFGVHNQLEPMLMQALMPLGAGAQEVAGRLIGYVDNTNVRVLGAVGLMVLLYSVLSLISKIEQVFNMTWRIERPRHLGERFSRYLSVLLVGPVLLFSALAMSASLRSNALVQRLVDIEPLGFLVHTGEQLVPYLLITLAFTFVYGYVPNTKVRLGPAAAGAAVAGLLWLSAGSLFADFMAGSTRWAAIYSGLAILILFMTWIYIAWLIVLIGANIAFYLQYPEYLENPDRDLRLSNRLRERFALELMRLVARRHFTGGEGATEEELARALHLPLLNVRKLVEGLSEGGFLLFTATTPPRLVPAQAPERVPLATLMRHVRRYGETIAARPQRAADNGVARIEQRLSRAMDESLGTMSLKDLAMPDADAESGDRDA